MKSLATHTTAAFIAFLLGLGAAHLLSTTPGSSKTDEALSTNAQTSGEAQGELSRSRATRERGETEGHQPEKDGAGLEQLVADLRARNAQLERQKVELEEQMQGLKDAIDNEVESYGLSHEYVSSLGAAAFSKNLVVTAEGQINHRLTNREVREINVRLREILEEFKELEDLNAYVEESESDEEYVLRVPPLFSGDELERSVEEIFSQILGAERGGELFRENRDVLAHALSGFGTWEHVITIYPDGSGFRLRDARIFPNGTGSTVRHTTIQPDELPPALQHLVQIND